MFTISGKPNNDLLLRAIRREPTPRAPVWLMRQAGRFDPKYLQIRQRCGLELEALFREPELAAEITMLPVRLGVDAAILFQDILTPLGPMGAPFVFRPGPILEHPIRTTGDVEKLRAYPVSEELDFIPRSIELALRELDARLPLIGFAGAPLTLATFLIEGRSPDGAASQTRALLHEQPSLCHQLLEKLTRITADHLRLQAEAGVHCVQLFESVADLYTRDEYQEFAHPYQKAVLAQLPETCPSILFVKEQPFVELMVESGAHAISVGRCVNLADTLARYGDRVAVQGNVDNRLLRDGRPDDVERAVRACLSAGGPGHILNLNHGILKGTPFENVRRFIDAGRSFAYEAVERAGAESQ